MKRINIRILNTATNLQREKQEITQKGTELRFKERIKQAPSREVALRLLDTIVPDIPPLKVDEI